MTSAWIDTFVQASVIMCLGMGIVFMFVASLVILIQVSARVLANCAEEEAAPAAPAAAPAKNDAAIVAAIAAAMKLHAQRQK